MFEVLLPADAEERPAVPPTPVMAPARGKTVLVIDDESMVREVLCHMIEDLGYHAMGVAGGGEAFAVLDERQATIDAAIVDLTMPRMNGSAVVEGLRARRRDLPIILTSGFDRDHASADDVAGFLRKPFRFETLEALLHDVVGAP